MNKEEFEQLKSTVKQWLFHTGSLDPTDYANELKVKFIEPREKRIEELEATNKKISNECHKLVYSLEKKQKENAALKHNKETVAHLGNICIEVAKQMLEEAKELLKEWIVCHGGTREFHSALQDKTEQFLKEVDNDR